MRAALWCPLRDARPAMDELADVFTFPRVRIAAGVDTCRIGSGNLMSVAVIVANSDLCDC